MAYIVFEQLLSKMLKVQPVIEYKFNEQRKWRIDYCFVKQKLAIEIEGGIWIKGRHTRGSGFLNDIEKYNNIILNGFALLRFTPEQLSTYGISTIMKWFEINYPDLILEK